MDAKDFYNLLLWPTSISQSLRSWTLVVLQFIDGWTARSDNSRFSSLWDLCLSSSSLYRSTSQLLLSCFQSKCQSRLTPVFYMLYVPQVGLSSVSARSQLPSTPNLLCPYWFRNVLKGLQLKHRCHAQRLNPQSPRLQRTCLELAGKL